MLMLMLIRLVGWQHWQRSPRDLKRVAGNSLAFFTNSRTIS